jgi:hypothetical protein
VLLQQFCEIAMIQEGLLARWREVDQEDQAAARAVERRVARGAKTLGLLASKLRLTPQSRVRYDAGQLDEKGAPAHRLLGGNGTAIGVGPSNPRGPTR